MVMIGTQHTTFSSYLGLSPEVGPNYPLSYATHKSPSPCDHNEGPPPRQQRRFLILFLLSLLSLSHVLATCDCEKTQLRLLLPRVLRRPARALPFPR